VINTAGGLLKRLSLTRCVVGCVTPC